MAFISLIIANILIVYGILFIVGIVLTFVGLFSWWLLKRKADDVTDYRTPNEVEVIKVYRVRDVVMSLIFHPIESIQSGKIVLYGRWKCILGTIGIVAVVIIIKCTVYQLLGVGYGILTAILVWMAIVGIGITRWFFSRINTLLFIYIGKVRISKQEGSLIFNIVFLTDFFIVSIVSIIYDIIFSHSENVPLMIVSMMLLMGISLIWLWWILYLILKKRYRLSTKESIAKLGLIILSKIGILIGIAGIIIGILYGITLILMNLLA